MTEPEEFTSLKGTTIPRKISVEYISFSVHVDYSQNSEFIEAVKAHAFRDVDVAKRQGQAEKSFWQEDR